MVLRLTDALKTSGITTILTHHMADVASIGHSGLAISSMLDTWILLQMVQMGRQRSRTLAILKARGTAHSNQVSDFVITGQGINW